MEATSCTLVTKEGEVVEVQAHLLSLLSPLLATLLSQAGPHPSLSLPCSSKQLRSLLSSLLREEEEEGEEEEVEEEVTVAVEVTLADDVVAGSCEPENKNKVEPENKNKEQC